MYHPDGSVARQAPSLLPIVHIGWLDPEHPWTRGQVAAHDRERLAAFCQHPIWSSLASNRCCLCLPPAFIRLSSGQPLGAGLVYVITANCIYACPDLIIHYVDEHDYAPPADLLRALHTCPLPQTPWYSELAARHGLGR